MNLTPKQLQAILLMVQGRTGREVAKKLGLTPQTVSQWAKIPEFEVMLNVLKMEIFASGCDSIRALSNTAVQCLKTLMESAQNEEVRRKAANDILTMAGIADPNDGRYACGIGPTSMSELQQKKTTDQILETLLMKTGSMK